MTKIKALVAVLSLVVVVSVISINAGPLDDVWQRLANQSRTTGILNPQDVAEFNSLRQQGYTLEPSYGLSPQVDQLLNRLGLTQSDFYNLMIYKPLK